MLITKITLWNTIIVQDAIFLQKMLFNCKYENHEKDGFLLCSKCVLECRNIYKKAFKNKSGEFVSIGIIKTRKERSLI